MPEIDYYNDGWKPNALYRQIIDASNAICAEYLGQGFDITLRQLYYQFVARGLLANKQENYDLLGRVCNKARWHGLMDWDYLVDRTRQMEQVPHWSTPGEILAAAAEGFRLDKWADADHVVEVWVEKEALVGVIEQAGRAADVPWFACRGYVSLSEIYLAAQRLVEHIQAGKEVTVLHLGDHDPSGLDMTDDNYTRLDRIVQYHVGADIDKLHFKRIALNPPQIAQYNPPPNFAKESDSRYDKYLARTGGMTDSWELDALDPAVLVALVADEVAGLRDDATWGEASQQEVEHRRLLDAVSKRWDDVVGMIDTDDEDA